MTLIKESLARRAAWFSALAFCVLSCSSEKPEESTGTARPNDTPAAKAPAPAAIAMANKGVNEAGLQSVAAANYVLYHPPGFEPRPPPTEEALAFYVKGNDSLNVSRFDLIAGQALTDELCKQLAQTFDDSEFRTRLKATAAKDVLFTGGSGQDSCYYAYEMPRGDTTAHIESRIVQKDGGQGYSVAAAYVEGSTEQESLRKALHAFAAKQGPPQTAPGSATGSAPIPDPIEPILVLVDHSEPSFSVFISVASGTAEEKIEGLRSKADQDDAVDLVTWTSFLK